jgi:hypothetical protein
MAFAILYFSFSAVVRPPCVAFLLGLSHIVQSTSKIPPRAWRREIRHNPVEQAAVVMEDQDIMESEEVKSEPDEEMEEDPLADVGPNLGNPCRCGVVAPGDVCTAHRDIVLNDLGEAVVRMRL